MKATRKICLALILCAFCATCFALLARPKPAALTSNVYCNASYPSCFLPVSSISRLMP
ncbi:hypothetical protein D9M73_280330 [compost metagenome]